jgi:hypothetical protein
MAFPNSYPVTADLKAWLRANSQQPLPSGDDTLLGNCIAAAIAFAEGPEGAGRRFEVISDSTRHFDALRDVDQGLRRLWLDEDLCQITSITNGDGVVIPVGQYVTNPRNETPYYAITLKLSSDYVWTYEDSPEDAIAIVGRWGYSTAAPADIAQAVLELAAYEYRRRSSSSSADQQVVTASGSVIVPSCVPKNIMAVFSGYRRLV